MYDLKWLEANYRRDLESIPTSLLGWALRYDMQGNAYHGMYLVKKLLADREYRQREIENYQSKKDEILNKELPYEEGVFELRRLAYEKSILQKEQFSLNSAYNEALSQLKNKEIAERRIAEERVNQPIEKRKPTLDKRLLVFKNSETIDKIHSELKGYFPNNEAQLFKALKGEQLTEKLLFPCSGSSFIEVFKRIRYNGFLISTPTEIKDWICKNFNFVKTQGAKKTVEDFKENSVWDILTKVRCEPPSKNRICTPDWLPFIPQKKRQREAKDEKL